MASGRFNISTNNQYVNGYVDWSSTTNISTNTSTLTLKAYLHRTNSIASAINNANITRYFYVAGVAYGGTEKITITLPATNAYVLFYEKSVTVSHNEDGTKTNLEIGFESTYTGSASTSFTVPKTTTKINLDTINRYATVTQSLGSKTETSVTINWSSDSTIDYVWYKVGSLDWTAVGSVNATSGSYTISSLYPLSQITVKTRVRRKDSQLLTISDDLTVETLAEQTVNQSLGSKTETSVIINWSSDAAANYVWYSINGGNKVAIGSASNARGSYTISGLSANTTYNIKTYLRRLTTNYVTSSTNALSVKTYSYPSQSLKSKTETSITMNWTSSETANYIWYSKDGGTNWVAVGNVNATSGSYTISGLSAGTSYSIRTRIRRSADSSLANTNNVNIITYDYPYATTTPDFIVGQRLEIALYNPLNRQLVVSLVPTNGTEAPANASGSSIGGFISDYFTTPLYKASPNSTKNTYKVKVYCEATDTTRTTSGSGTYSIPNLPPTFSTFEYADSDSFVVNITENNQYIVKNKSNLRVKISSTNKMAPQKYANPDRYEISCGNRTKSLSYSANDTYVDLGTINSSGTMNIIVTAYDKRGFSTKVTKSITIIDYANIVQKNTIGRLNDFENDTKLKIEGTFSLVQVAGTTKNSVEEVKYRYKPYGGTYNAYTSLTPVISGNKYSIPIQNFNLDNKKAFVFEVLARDKFGWSLADELLVDEGVAILFLNSTKKNVGIGCINEHEEYSLEINNNLYIDGNKILYKENEDIKINENAQVGKTEITLKQLTEKRIISLHGAISSKGIFILADYVNNYSLILVTCTSNLYNHWSFTNMYIVNNLGSTRQLRCGYWNYDNSSISYSGYILMYDNKIDTTNFTTIDDSLHIVNVIGIKL